MKKVAIIDYGVGNLLSLKMALEHLGGNVVITNNKNEILNSSHIILPGVGAFSKAMELIKSSNLDKTLKEVQKKGSFILGICLGMQLLLSESEEFGMSKGLNFFNGKVVSINKSPNYSKNIKIPNIGWFNIYNKNKISFNNLLFEKLTMQDSFYFVHSFMATTDIKDYQVYVTDYSGIEIPAIIIKDNIIGFQFHPEKSGNSGLKLLNNFMKL